MSIGVSRSRLLFATENTPFPLYFIAEKFEEYRYAIVGIKNDVRTCTYIFSNSIFYIVLINETWSANEMSLSITL